MLKSKQTEDRLERILFGTPAETSDPITELLLHIDNPDEVTDHDLEALLDGVKLEMNRRKNLSK